MQQSPKGTLTICSNGSFTIELDSRVISSASFQGGQTKKRSYIYNKHRYTKVVVHKKKKCIYCKTEDRYIPVKTLKGGTNEAVDPVCQKMTLPPDLMKIIMSKAFNSDELGPKDLLPFFIVVSNDPITTNNGNPSYLLSFLKAYMQSQLNIHDSFEVSLYKQDYTNYSFTFTKTNVNATVVELYNFLKDIKTLDDIIEIEVLTESGEHVDKVQKFVALLNVQKMKEIAKEFTTEMQELKDVAQTLRSQIRRGSKKTQFSNEERVQSSRLFKLFIDVFATFREMKNNISNPENFAIFRERMHQDLDWARRVLDEARTLLDIVNDKTSNVAKKQDAYSKLRYLIDSPEAYYEPDSPDDYDVAFSGY